MKNFILTGLMMAVTLFCYGEELIEDSNISFVIPEGFILDKNSDDNATMYYLSNESSMEAVVIISSDKLNEKNNTPIAYKDFIDNMRPQFDSDCESFEDLGSATDQVGDKNCYHTLVKYNIGDGNSITVDFIFIEVDETKDFCYMIYAAKENVAKKALNFINNINLTK